MIETMDITKQFLKENLPLMVFLGVAFVLYGIIAQILGYPYSKLAILLGVILLVMSIVLIFVLRKYKTDLSGYDSNF